MVKTHMFFLRKHLPGHSASAAHGGLSEVSLPPLPSQLPRLPSAPSLQRQLRKVLEHHEVIEVGKPIDVLQVSKEKPLVKLVVANGETNGNSKIMVHQWL